MREVSPSDLSSMHLIINIAYLGRAKLLSGIIRSIVWT